MTIKYAVQPYPNGLAEAFIRAQIFSDTPAALVLGDNLFHGHELISQLRAASERPQGGTVFAYPVRDPKRYGVVEFDDSGNALSIEEKPEKPRSRYAVTGLYFYDASVVERARQVRPSARGELEITSLNQMYLDEQKLTVELMDAWLRHRDLRFSPRGRSLHPYSRAASGSEGKFEEVAWRQGWINDEQLERLAQPLLTSGYGSYLLQMLQESEGDHALLQRNLEATNRNTSCRLNRYAPPLARSQRLANYPKVFGDERGFFYESWNERNFRQHLISTGVPTAEAEAFQFRQDNHSCSTSGVLRGLHYQLPPETQEN